jgi:nucleoside-diphosphate-sugar epimerase
MSNYNLVISGGNGFLGKAIISFFKKKKVSISKIDIKQSFFENFNEKKINDYLNKSYKRNKLNIFIHLGWGAMGEPFSDYHKINYQKSKLIFKFCSFKKFEKIIFCGSINEYGNRKGGLVENHKPKNIKTKYAKYKLLTTNYGVNNISNFFSIRSSYIYGYSQRRDTLIDLLIKSIKFKKTIMMSHCKIYRDYIFVEDVAEAFYKIIFTNIPGGVYNVGSGKLITLKKLISEISKRSGFNKKYLKFGSLIKRKEQQAPKSFLITKKINKYCDWKINNSLDEGIDKILKFNKINTY